MANSKFTKYSMYGCFIFLISAICVSWIYYYRCWFYYPTTVMLVRHAEKGSAPPGDPYLTSAGEARAAKLVHVVGSSGIKAIFVSNTNRSRRTAQDLADSLNIVPTEMSASAVDEMSGRILNDFRGQTVLVIGHTNTIPDIVEKLGGGNMPDINEAVYDNLFIVSVCRCYRGVTKVINLKYGELTPRP